MSVAQSRPLCDSQDSDRAYVEAFSLYKSGSFSVAVKVLLRSQRRETGVVPDIKTLLLLGRCLVGMRDFRRAIPLYASLTRILPRLKEPWWAMLYCLLAMKKGQEACVCLRRYLHHHKSSREAWRRLARLAVKLGRADTASEALNHCPPSKDPVDDLHDAGLCVDIGDIHASRGEPDRAIAFFSRATALDPTNKSAFRKMAELRRGQGRAREALLYARQLVDVDTADSASLLLAGSISVDLQEWDLSIFYLEKYMELVPDDLEVRLSKARAHHALGELFDARSEYAKALAQRPRCVEAAWALATIARARGESTRERAFLSRVLLINPEHLAGLDRLAHLMYESGRYAEAVGMFERVLLLKPGHLDTVLILGKATRRAGCLGGARVHLERVRARRPHDLTVLLELGQVEMALGERTSGVKTLEQVIQLAPGSDLALLAQYEIGSIKRPAVMT